MNTRTLYLDLDGVLADWRSEVTKILGHHNVEIGQRYTDEDWAKITEHEHIFRNLKLLDGATELVALARKFRDNLGFQLFFLTAVPERADIPWAFYDKTEWCKEHFPDIIAHFGPYASDKKYHCKQGDILVDDHPHNCEQWTNAGGISVMVKDVRAATKELEAIYISIMR